LHELLIRQVEINTMQIFDNITNKVKDDLSITISKGSHISIASACFSIYAFETLKKQLEDISELRFVFTSPTLCG